MSLSFGFQPTHEDQPEVEAPQDEAMEEEVEFLAVPVTLFAAEVTPQPPLLNPWNDFAPVLARS